MKKKSKVDFGAYAFLIPAAVIYLSVIVIPVFYSLFISLFKWNGVAEKEFVGLANYINLFTNDATFMIALKNNLIWIVLTIVLLMTVSLGFAVILNKQFRIPRILLFPVCHRTYRSSDHLEMDLQSEYRIYQSVFQSTWNQFQTDMDF